MLAGAKAGHSESFCARCQARAASNRHSGWSAGGRVVNASSRTARLLRPARCPRACGRERACPRALPRRAYGSFARSKGSALFAESVVGIDERAQDLDAVGSVRRNHREQRVASTWASCCAARWKPARRLAGVDLARTAFSRRPRARSLSLRFWSIAGSSLPARRRLLRIELGQMPLEHLGRLGKFACRFQRGDEHVLEAHLELEGAAQRLQCQGHVAELLVQASGHSECLGADAGRSERAANGVLSLARILGQDRDEAVDKPKQRLKAVRSASTRPTSELMLVLGGRALSAPPAPSPPKKKSCLSKVGGSPLSVLASRSRAYHASLGQPVCGPGEASGMPGGLVNVLGP